eukprot:CAMPEP_0182465022 /NCGR_PEP_ID=MMETSP1319-20130603/8956_1 /TAXON_ID=172717 /ORGANISM="Bolidomonas pacifica, Strain RCC208" /LENGTH=165 /DNA_ID=CAMNT_0024664699 /DNA_START=98 /DNA_END=595 /DNA_ORIENTATION=-
MNRCLYLLFAVIISLGLVSPYTSPNDCDMDRDLSEDVVNAIVGALPMCVYTCFSPAGISLSTLALTGTLPTCDKTEILVNCSRAGCSPSDWNGMLCESELLQFYSCNQTVPVPALSKYDPAATNTNTGGDDNDDNDDNILGSAAVGLMKVDVLVAGVAFVAAAML